MVISQGIQGTARISGQTVYDVTDDWKRQVDCITPTYPGQCNNDAHDGYKGNNEIAGEDVTDI